MSVSSCVAALSYYEGTAQHIAIYVHIVASLLSIFVTSAFLIYGRKMLYFHRNFKILIYILLVGYLVHGVSLAGLQIVHTYVLWTSTNLCDLYLSNLFCYWSRLPSAGATNLFIYCQMAMIVERIVATNFLGKYEKMNSYLGVILGVFVVLLAIGSVLLMFKNWDLSQQTTYCGTSNNFTVEEVFYVTCIFNTIVALVTFLGCFIVMRYNKAVTASSSTLADMVRRYQNSENVIVLKILAPQTTFLTVFLVLYGTLNGISFYFKPDWTSSQIFKSTLTFVNIIPYYTVLSPLLIWYHLKKYQVKRRQLLQRMSQDKTDGHAYFTALKTMWS